MVNGLKPKIYENDFQIFNEDNYSIDLFAKFLRKIIFEINESILKNNFENDFLKKHLIKINTKEFYHFISAKLFNADKHELNKEKNENNIKNPLIKIRMYQEKNEKKNYNENNNKNSNEKSVSISAAYSEEIKNKSDDLEYIINTLLTDNFKGDELISIPNILFMFNLKIPKYNEKKNSIEFNSVYLDYTNKETKLENENYCYGFKEIDAAFRSISKNFIYVNKFEFFMNNIQYIKENNTKNFIYKNYNDKNFAIYPDSIFFCEIKYRFPDLSRGREKVIPVQMKTKEESKNNLTLYQVQLEKLLKKFIFFFDIYKKTINQKNIQIVFLYDNVEAIKVLSFDKIKEDTEKILKKLADKFQKFNKIIFQLIYFNYSDYTVKEMLESKQKDKTIEEKNETIKNQGNELNNKDQIIQEKEHEIKRKDQTIIQQGNKLNNKVQIIQEKENEIMRKDQTIIQQGNELNNKDQIIQEKDQIIMEKESEINEFKNQINEINEIMENPNLEPNQKMALIKKLYKK